MGRKGRRRRLELGIYEDMTGRSVIVQVRGLQRELRFPQDTDLDRLRQQRDQLRADLHEEVPAHGRGTLAADAERYLKQMTGRPGSKADRSHLRAWLDRLGLKQRGRITAADVHSALAAWRTAGTWVGGRGRRVRRPACAPASEKTLKERWRVLRHLYKTLDGPKTRTPCDDVPRPKPPAPTPVGVPASTVQVVALALKARAKGTRRTSPARQDAARFLMVALTGQRPSQVARARPEDFHLQEGFWVVRGAKGGPTHAMYLNREMRQGVRAFLASEAFGPWDTSRFARLLRAHGWPKDIPPYAARHSVAMDALACGADLGDVQALLGHTHIDTTRRFYAPIVAARQQAAAKLLEGRLKNS